MDKKEEILRKHCAKGAAVGQRSGGTNAEAVERPCMMCKKEIGNDVFTVCDGCWDKSREAPSGGHL